MDTNTNNNLSDTDTNIDWTPTPRRMPRTEEERAEERVSFPRRQAEDRFEAALAAVSRADSGPFPAASAAEKLWKAATAAERHAQRVAATLAAASVEGLVLGVWGPYLTPGGARTLSVLAVVIDSLGEGGRLGISGGRSARKGAFGRLGKGRRQASDGRAYGAAASSALWRLRCDADPEVGNFGVEDLVLGMSPSGDLQAGMALLGETSTEWVAVAMGPQLAPLLSRLALCQSGVPGWEVEGVRSALKLEEVAGLLERCTSAE